MTKENFIRAVQELVVNECGTKYSLHELNDIYQAMFTTIYNNLKSKEEMSLFGVQYKMKEYPDRTGMCNGRPWSDSAHIGVKVKMTKPLRDIRIEA